MNKDIYDQNYTEFHLRLLNAFIEKASCQIPFCLEECSQEDQEFLKALQRLSTIGGVEQLIQGQELLCKIVAGYPQLMLMLPRDLLWFFGGDCMHYMPDEEISIFQSLDDERQAAREASRTFFYEQARALALGLH